MAKFAQDLFVEYGLWGGVLQEFNNYHKAKVTNLEELNNSKIKTIEELCYNEQVLKKKVERLDSCFVA